MLLPANVSVPETVMVTAAASDFCSESSTPAVPVRVKLVKLPLVTLAAPTPVMRTS